MAVATATGRRWRIGVIGCGEWGPNHVRNFAALPDAEVVGVADLDADRLIRMKTQAPKVPQYRDGADLLARATLDAVVIATSTGTHHPIARQALLAGIHVLSEKPLCSTPEDADDLVALAARMNRRLMVGHVFLFNPGILKLKALVDGNHLGRIVYLSARRTNLGPIRSDVNAVFDLASHDVSIYNYLLNAMPIEVSAVGRAFLQPSIHDVASVTLRYPGDVMASIHVSWLDPRKVRDITVSGDVRMAVWDDLAALGPVMVFDKGVTRREYTDFGEFQLLAREGDVTVPRVVPEEPLRAQARAFLASLDSPEPTVSDGRMGADVVRVLAAINDSLARRGAPIAVSGVTGRA